MLSRDEQENIRLPGESAAVDLSDAESDSDGYSTDDSETWGEFYWQKDDNNVGTVDKVKDLTRWTLLKTKRNMTFAGDVFINFFGLDQSRYQWVQDMVNYEQYSKEQRELEERQRKWLAKQKNATGSNSDVGKAVIPGN